MRLFILALLCLTGCIGAGDGFTYFDSGASDAVQDAMTEPVPEVQSPLILDAGLTDGSFDLRQASTGNMVYYGGPVLVSPINVYFIWYGNWSNPKTAPILEDMIRHIGNSTWFQINTSYYQQAIPNPPVDAGSPTGDGGSIGARPNIELHPHHYSVDAGSISSPDAGAAASGQRLYVTSTISFLKSVYIGYTHGKTIMDDDIISIVEETIGSNKLPSDPDGVYFVFASADVLESDAYGEQFCSSFCGWHGNHTVLGQNTRLAFVGDTGSCSGCSLQNQYAKFGFTSSPNGDWSADSMASVIAHELAESATDPDDLTSEAWRDMYGYENADRCSWIFGQPYITDNGSVANVPIGSRSFMIQENWVLGNNNGDGHCGLMP